MNDAPHTLFTDFVVLIVIFFVVCGVFMGETDVIGHLIDIEREAAEVLFDAQEKSDAMVSAAKNEAESEFKSGYEVAVKEFEDSYEQNREKISDEYNELMQQSEDKIKSAPKDVSGFNNLLDGLLFGN